MIATELKTAQVSLEAECSSECANFAFPLYQQLNSGYEICSVLPIPADYLDWEDGHRTARKRVLRALARGYYVARIKREEHVDAIWAINTSLEIRQGKPMTVGYLERPRFAPLPDYPCARHGIRTWGVLTHNRRLVGYLTVYRAGELALVSQILGHGDYLKDEIMWLLFSVALGYEVGEPGHVVYNRADSGTEGLRWWKEHAGFEPTRVHWTL